MPKNLKTTTGFTFIELILYLSIVTIIMSALIPFAWDVIVSGTKNSTQQFVYSQARFISDRIKWEIRNATDINSVAATSISLATSVAATNPTVIDLNSGQIRITQGANPTVSLVANNTEVTSLSFVDYSDGGGDTKNIQFSFTINADFNAAGHEYQATTSIQSAAEVRTN